MVQSTSAPPRETEQLAFVRQMLIELGTITRNGHHEFLTFLIEMAISECSDELGAAGNAPRFEG